mgnify:FL=1
MPTSNNLRLQIVGTSGSGKSTLAKKLAADLNLKRLELDSIYHQANWTPLPQDEFRSQVADFTSTDAWIVDGNYSMVRDILDGRITHLIWLDYPRWLVMFRVIRRTLWRGISRKELWNGNRENPRDWLSRNREENIMLWAFTTHESNRQRYLALFDTLPNVVKIRIGSPFQASRLLKSLTA